MTVYKHITNSLSVFCEFQVRSSSSYEAAKRELKLTYTLGE
ncbi:hypothetical protein BAOM_5070 [Peribacillus asahii]|uniref:Uncharacterized protein n=1 Tax=Peribacillus asahii TaxID=228899 RepID=A0A3T0KZ51_9BACI|nr:hypothetical protein [Peribacillus asahii]AZV45599.1 hypothetical protein BAOM_5070 [Peribacillus asahii]